MDNFYSSNELEPLPKRLPKYKLLYAFYGFGAVIFTVVFYVLVLSAPTNFPAGGKIMVGNGASLRSVSLLLQEKNIIRSRVAFEFFIILFGDEKRIVTAEYAFDRKVPVFEVARRIGGGESRTPPIAVTIPEGFNIQEIGDAFGRELPQFNKINFLERVKEKEGYLFPDTYFFLSTENEDAVIKSMSANFEKKISPLRKDIAAQGKSEKDIITMASIIEREAKGDNDRELISGILWRRLSIGMALQVDVAPDTYKTPGLPEKPIANPGLKAIKASIYPKSSEYLYYLHDKKGEIHFARNFKEHTANVAKYLK